MGLNQVSKTFNLRRAVTVQFRAIPKFCDIKIYLSHWFYYVQLKVFVSTSKRKRGPNWSEKEKHVLVEEYKRHRHILRPKPPNVSSVAERDRVWEEICGALKAVSGPYVKRDIVDMRKKWDNLCFWAKKCIAEWKDKNSADGMTRLMIDFVLKISNP